MKLTACFFCFTTFAISISANVDPVKQLQKKVESLSNTVGALSHQMMLQQLFIEEKIRADADSGVKQVRNFRAGTRNYHSASHTSSVSVVSIHDHSNNDRTVGMGEFVGVLNGVEFRTRHNDYRLYMPHRTSNKWHATENIPFPDVPPEVLNKQNVSDQITEMHEWFKAWRDQNYTVRDYRKYFKPVLCYLEGAWTTTTSGKIDEPFESDRHFIDASSWFDLQQKVLFTSYTGRKDNLENYSFLPTTIINVTNGIPQFAQWNYRILCHPISRDLPLNRFRVVDELASQLAAKRNYEDHSKTRAARFQLNPFDRDTWVERVNGARWGLLDELMAEIPGKDNYHASLVDTAFDLTAYSKDPKKKGTLLDASKYHRWFIVSKKGAMGSATRHRGFADDSVFMAMNTQPKVAGMNLEYCRKLKGNKKSCKYLTQRWSYAIPLEIIYLTPLNKWNPHDIQYKGAASSPLGRTVESGGRNGGVTPAKAYDGTNSRKFYQTPVEFFSGGEIGAGAADTTKNSVGVLDKKGNVRTCKASGTRIFLPNIPGVGTLRQRYPIMPIHGEGSAVWKELEAVKDLLLRSKTYGYAFRETLTGGSKPSEPDDKGSDLQVTRSTNKRIPEHTHEIFLTKHEVSFLRQGGDLNVTTSESTGHEHTLMLQYRGRRYYIKRCDSHDTAKTRCMDRHGRFPIVMLN